ncbi:MAG: class I SAM-dependent methyltransferase [Desulfobulbaceae bacterium]|nr:class I SAM-dependent methyltransferase [Desulfobulbaceae bacterium]
MNRNNTIREDTSERHKNKYYNKNFIHQYTLGSFFDKIAAEVKFINPNNALEFGCGEGLFLEELKKRDVIINDLTGIDLRKDAIEYAQKLHSEYYFECIDIFDFNPDKKFELVIASQVLEHLLNPPSFLTKLACLSSHYLLLTVPWEPWFQIMNLLRGRDILRLGNHPEHVNRWNKNEFCSLILRFADIKHTILSFPFIIIVAEVRN